MPPTHDIPKIFSLGSIGIKPERRTVNQLTVSAHFLLRAIDQFASVRTDRLHVAIAAAMLGKTVELYDNSYYKNRAVFDFSLSSLLNVRFKSWG